MGLRCSSGIDVRVRWMTGHGIRSVRQNRAAGVSVTEVYATLAGLWKVPCMDAAQLGCVGGCTVCHSPERRTAVRGSTGPRYAVR